MHADASFVPPLVYAMMGTSKHMAVGPVATASLVMASVLETEVQPAENPTLYMHLALTATFFGGIFQAALGILRLQLDDRRYKIEKLNTHSQAL